MRFLKYRSLNLIYLTSALLSAPLSLRGQSTQPSACILQGTLDDKTFLDPPAWQPVTPAPKTDNVYGRVIDPSGKPVANATVHLEPLYWYSNGHKDVVPGVGQTDADGYYSLKLGSTVPLNGDLQIFARGEGFQSRDDKAPDIRFAGESSRLRRDIVVQPAAIVSINVKGTDGKPMAGISVGAERYASTVFGYPFREEGEQTTTDKNGQIYLTLPVRPTPWTICAYVLSKAPGQANVLISSPADRPKIDLVLENAETYDGLAVCADSGFPRGYTISLAPIGNQRADIQCQVDKRGKFTAENAGPGRYFVTVRRGEDWQFIGTTTLQPELDRIEIHVPGPAPAPWTQFSVKVNGPDGWQSSHGFVQGIELIAVNSIPYGGIFIYYRGNDIAKDGSVIDMKRVPAGNYQVTLITNGHETVTRDNVEVPGPQPVFNLENFDSKKRHIEELPILRVRDANTGKPVNDFLYRFFQPGNLNRYGNWIQVNTPTGQIPLLLQRRPYEIEVSANGYAVGWERNFVADFTKAQTIVDIGLSPGGSVTGKLIDSAGDPLAGAAIFAKSHRSSRPQDHLGISENEYPVAITDASGVFVIPHLQSGDDQLFLTHLNKCLQTEITIHVAEGQQIDIGRITVNPSATPVDDRLTNRD